MVKQIPVIAQKCNSKSGELSLEKSLFIDKTTIDKYDYTKRVKLHDIVINSTGGGTVGRVGIVKDELFKEYDIIVTDSHITTLRVMKNINPYYIYYYLKSPFIIDHVEEKCEGSTNQIELYSKVIMAYPLPLPPYDEQNRIVNKINSLFHYIIV